MCTSEQGCRWADMALWKSWDADRFKCWNATGLFGQTQASTGFEDGALKPTVWQMSPEDYP